MVAFVMQVRRCNRAVEILQRRAGTRWRRRASWILRGRSRPKCVRQPAPALRRVGQRPVLTAYETRRQRDCDSGTQRRQCRPSRDTARRSILRRHALNVAQVEHAGAGQQSIQHHRKQRTRRAVARRRASTRTSTSRATYVTSRTQFGIPRLSRLWPARVGNHGE